MLFPRCFIIGDISVTTAITMFNSPLFPPLFPPLLASAMRCGLFAALLLSCWPATAHTSYRLALADGLLLVADEGMHEPRSIGSYSLRLYAPLDERFPYDNFVAGVTSERDGSLERLMSADIDSDGRQDAVVVIRTAGSGGYLSGHAYAVEPTGVRLLSRVEGLAPGADVVSALRAALKGAARPEKTLLPKSRRRP